jgi:cell division septum initiation protein DivIVA
VAFTGHVPGRQDPPPAADEPQPGLGHRIEKVLRAAQREADEIRENAELDADALLSRARAEVEAEDLRRHRLWADREAAVGEAERQSTDGLAAARQQAAELLAAAEQEAQCIRGHAHNRAHEIRTAAEQAAERHLQQAHAEVERLGRVRDATRADLNRLIRALSGMRDALAYELDPRAAAPRTGADPIPRPRGPASPPGPSDNGASPGRPGLGNDPGDYRRSRAAAPDPDTG